MFGYIYKINLPNGKFYIGQKHGQIDEYYFGSGILINNWFKKYIGCPSGHCLPDKAEEHGVKRQILSEIWEPFDQEYLDLDEHFWITFWRELDEENCLNIASGGWNGENSARKSGTFRHSEETKKKLSDMQQNVHRYTDGIHNITLHDGETIPQGFHPGLTKSKHIVKMSDETKEKISKKVSGENNGMYNKVPYNKGKQYKKVYKDKITKMIPIEELDKYLSDGWLLGDPKQWGRTPWNKGLVGGKCSEITKKAWKTKRGDNDGSNRTKETKD